jgi:signal transduction histidine kinase
MRSFESPYLVDWLAVSLRWLAVVSAALVAGSSATAPPVALTALFGVAALWNVVLGTLAGLRQHMGLQRIASTIGDALFASLLFWWSGGFTAGFWWIGVLPLMSAALYFGLRGVLVMTLISLAAQGLISLTQVPLASLPFILTVLLGLNLVVGLMLSYLQRGLQRALPVLQSTGAPDQDFSNGPDPRQALYQMITSLNSTLNYHRVLETALDVSLTAVQAGNGKGPDRMVCAVLLFTGDDASELEVASARGFAAVDLRTTLPGNEGLVGAAIDEFTPMHTQDIRHDSELSRFTSLHSCTSAYCVPLRTGLDVCGVLLFGSPNPNFFAPEQRENLDIIANQAMVALENARLYQSLEAEKERMMEAQEEARKKMARDLHDGPTQSVAAIAMRVNFARRLMERDEKAAADELLKIEDMARRTTKEIRHMLFTLRPLVLESQGLTAALDSMAEKTFETYGQSVLIEADPSLVDEIEMGKQGVIFSIAEEAVNNARKHAQAHQIHVRLHRVEQDFALLEIEDDGVGFDSSAVDSSYENRGSLGMVNMRERTELVNGAFRLNTAPGKGTCVQVLVPLNEQAADRLRRGM